MALPESSSDPLPANLETAPLCPFCHGPVVSVAAACRHCGREIVVFNALDSRLSALERAEAAFDERVRALIAAAGANRPTTDTGQTAGDVPPAALSFRGLIVGDWPRWPGYVRVALHLLLATVALLLAQLICVFVFDASFQVVIATLVAIAALQGHRAGRVLGREWLGSFAVSLAVAIVSTFVMTLPISLVDQTPLLPALRTLWQQDAKAVIAILLAHFVGTQISTISIARLFQAPKAESATGSVSAADYDPSAAAKALAQRIKNWVDAAVIVATAAFAIWATFAHHPK